MTESIGRINLGTAGYKAGGKLIDEWSFHQPFTGKEGVPPYRIEVYLRKRHAGIGKSAIDFVAHCPALPGGRLESSDIEALRVQVEETLREQAILRSGVLWEDWLEVIVRGAKRRHTGAVASEELSIEYKTLRRGRHAELPGRDYTINFNHVAVPFPQPKKAGSKGTESFDGGEGFTGLMSDGRDEDAEYAYIPDSPENRAALEQLIGSLKLLGSRLAEFLGQDNIGNAVVALQDHVRLLSAR